MYLKIQDVSTIWPIHIIKYFNKILQTHSVPTCNYVAIADYIELTNTEQIPHLNNIDAIFRMWRTSLTTDLQEHFHFISSKHTFLPTEKMNWIRTVKIMLNYFRTDQAS